MPAQNETTSEHLDVFIVDDEAPILDVLADLFTDESEFRITTESRSERAMEILLERDFDIVITDLVMEPGPGGIELLKTTKKLHPETLVIIITGFASLETTLQAIKYGAYDYITKPFQIEEFHLVVRNAADKIIMKRTLKSLKERVEELENKLLRTSEENTRLLKHVEHLRKSGSSLRDSTEANYTPPPPNAEKTVSRYAQASRTQDQIYQKEVQRLRYLHDTGKIGEADYLLAIQKLRQRTGTVS